MLSKTDSLNVLPGLENEPVFPRDIKTGEAHLIKLLLQPNGSSSLGMITIIIYMITD